MKTEDLEALVAENEDLFDASWPGIEFRPGWNSLFAEMLILCRERKSPALTRSQEKLGTLRLYFSDQGHPVARSIREEAMLRSAGICEICGAPGQLTHPCPGYLATRCQAHQHD